MDVSLKKLRFMLMLILCGVFFGGCADREKEGEAWRGIQAGMDDLTEITERTEYYDIVSEVEEIFHLGIGDESPKSALKETGKAQFPLGMQFYQGEPVQLWAEAHPAASDICLYRTDGSRELLLEGVPTAYTFFDNSYSWSWHISQEGDFYCWRRANYSISHPEYVDDDKKAEAVFAKISASGEIVYEKTFAPGVSVEDFCQLSDGKCWLILKNEAEQARTLAELESASGRILTADKVQMISSLMGSQILGTTGGALAVFNYETGSGMEIVELNPADGTKSCLLSFTGTSYIREYSMTWMQDFRVLEDGSVEILRLDSGSDAKGILERLRMAKVEKTPIVVRGIFISDPWITGMAAKFNQQSADYHVVIEDCGMGNDTEDFARLTSIQLAAGKGPDMIQANFMQDYISGMLEKGILEDLSPYMENSGIREEDYFPAVFGTWRNAGHIYGINPRMDMTGYRMDESVLGGREEPDIEKLADSLLSWEGKAVYLSGKDSQELLETFLKGTETLWGMVDWERGSCDFGGGLFVKLLEAAGRYGDDERKGQLPCIAERMEFYEIYKFDSAAVQEREGKVTCGVIFDDGCHAAAASWRTMAIVSGSPNKEGAWEFLQFLLGDEAQSPNNLSFPVSRKNFELWLEKQTERAADGKEVHNIVVTGDKTTYVETYTEEDLTEEKIAEYRKTLEEAKPYPIRTAPILDIILEESEDYFNGSKSAEQVKRVVTNRVQLYLDEMR